MSISKLQQEEKSAEENCWQFTMQGEYMEFSRKNLHGKVKTSYRLPTRWDCLTKEDLRRKYSGLSLSQAENTWKTLLMKRRNRRIARLMRLLSSIDNHPELFITLTVDRRQRPYQTSKIEQKVFEKFTRTLIRRFRYAWFVYKKEYSTITGIHYHLIGNMPGNDGKINFDECQNIIKDIWDKSNKFIWEKSTCVEKYQHEHRGYLCKPKKRADDIRCVMLLGKSRMIGVIGAKNIQFHKTYIVLLTHHEKKVFFRELKTYCQETGSYAWFVRQRKHNQGNFAFVPRSIMVQALKTATGKEWE